MTNEYSLPSPLLSPASSPLLPHLSPHYCKAVSQCACLQGFSTHWLCNFMPACASCIFIHSCGWFHIPGIDACAVFQWFSNQHLSFTSTDGQVHVESPCTLSPHNHLLTNGHPFLLQIGCLCRKMFQYYVTVTSLQMKFVAECMFI